MFKTGVVESIDTHRSSFHELRLLRNVRIIRVYCRSSGLSATPQAQVTTGGEENALCLQNDRCRVEDIVLHEFSHGLHLLGTNYVIRGFDGRLRNLYNR